MDWIEDIRKQKVDKSENQIGNASDRTDKDKNLAISICDDDELSKKKRQEVLVLELASVRCDILQRPSANNLKVKMGMRKLTVTGYACGRTKVPVIVSTKDFLSVPNQESSNGTTADHKHC